MGLIILILLILLLLGAFQQVPNYGYGPTGGIGLFARHHSDSSAARSCTYRILR